MRSTPPEQDLTTRARIRDAAVQDIGEHGFPASTVRSIAARAGVSPALVIHHFGSKDSLRRACDDHVLATVSKLFQDSAEHFGPDTLVAQVHARPELAPLAQYVVRAMTDGGPLAQHVFDRTVTDTEQWLRALAARGQLKPMADPHGWARLLTAMGLGTRVMGRYLSPDSTMQQRMSRLSEELMEPTLELFTHGLFATTEFLDAYRSLESSRQTESTEGPDQ